MRRDQVSVVCRYERSADGPWVTALTDWLLVWLPFDLFSQCQGIFSFVVISPLLRYKIKLWITFLGIRGYYRSCMFLLNLNEGFLQLSCAWVTDPERGINPWKGGNIRVILAQLILLAAESKMKSVTVWMCVCTLVLLPGKKFHLRITLSRAH